MKTILAGLLVVFLGMGRMMAADSAPNGPVVGIGVELRLVDQHPVVDQVIPGQPASKGGIKAGDRLLTVEGKNVEGLPLADISKMLQGAVKSRVHVTVLRPGEKKSRSFSLRRQMVTLPGSELPKGP